MGPSSGDSDMANTYFGQNASSWGRMWEKDNKTLRSRDAQPVRHSLGGFDSRF